MQKTILGIKVIAPLVLIAGLCFLKRTVDELVAVGLYADENGTGGYTTISQMLGLGVSSLFIILSLWVCMLVFFRKKPIMSLGLFIREEKTEIIQSLGIAVLTFVVYCVYPIVGVCMLVLFFFAWKK